MWFRLSSLRLLVIPEATKQEGPVFRDVKIAKQEFSIEIRLGGIQEVKLKKG